ncbi:MAG: GntR family transcriptional regulator [Halodesulfovibrio sp.]
MAGRKMSETKYLKIYNWLSDQISNKTFKPGDKIPNESELAEMFNVHRMTVRNAVDKLMENYMLIKIRGKGTFLLSESKTTLTKSLEDITSYYDDTIKAGLTPRYKTLEVQIIEQDSYIGKKLGLDIGEPVVFIKRLMLANEIPMVIEYCYLPENLFPDILDKKLNTILYKVIREEYGMKLMHSSQEIGAILPTEKDRKILKISNTCACIQVEGIVFNEFGHAVEYTKSIYRGDKYKFKCSIGNYIIEQ